MTIGNNYTVIDARAYVGRHGGGYGPRPLSAVQRISIHHSVGNEPQDVDGELAELDSIARFHVEGRGWPGFAYHLAIAPSGRVYSTGDLGTLRYVVGNGNRENVAICLLGDFTDHPPTDAALHAAWACAHEIQYELGRFVPILGHRDTPGTEPTACPGTTYRDWLPRIAGEPVADASATPGTQDPTLDLSGGGSLTKAQVIDLIDRLVPTKYDTDPAVIKSQVQHESGFRSNAIGDSGHSVGLLQLHDQGMGHGMTLEERLDPETNLRKALEQHVKNRDEFGSIEAALTAHNAGYGAVRRAYNAGGDWRDVIHHGGVTVADLYTLPIMRDAENYR